MGAVEEENIAVIRPRGGDILQRIGMRTTNSVQLDEELVEGSVVGLAVVA